jgi:NAD(P)-dependent dehydrogenase (short-subunit alcohol dehydrogenase family)
VDVKIQLKSLDRQVIVITGASSGIGLATARRAARKGAKLVLAARSVEDLNELVGEIRGKGGDALAVQADVGVEEDVHHIAAEAVGAFGGFDTWVNNAGVSIYGPALDIATDDMRRLFETNFWGVVYGSRAACEHLRRRGGALINIGSEVSDKAAPLQAAYSASKHAVKGWTDALRMELEYQAAPISVTLIKPGAIDTPYPEHARNYMPDFPKPAAPVYAPDSVAAAILHAATTPVRDMFVGGGARFLSSLDRWAPRTTDRLTERMLIPGTHSGEPRNGHDALYEPGGGLSERGHYPGMVRRSMYTRASIHPVLSSAAAVGAGLLVTMLWRTTAQQGSRVA